MALSAKIVIVGELSRNYGDDRRMIVYFDVSCLNRPYDDQSQARVRMESEAVLFLMERCLTGGWKQVSSTVALAEISMIMDGQRRERVMAFLPDDADVWECTPTDVMRARELEGWGFHAADALHLASAEATEAAVFVTCDDRLLRRAIRYCKRLRVRVANPVDLLGEVP